MIPTFFQSNYYHVSNIHGTAHILSSIYKKSEEECPKSRTEEGPSNDKFIALTLGQKLTGLLELKNLQK